MNGIVATVEGALEYSTLCAISVIRSIGITPTDRIKEVFKLALVIKENVTGELNVLTLEGGVACPLCLAVNDVTEVCELACVCDEIGIRLGTGTATERVC